MWSIALLCSFAAGHPHHGLKHSGGKKVGAPDTLEWETLGCTPAPTVVECVNPVDDWGDNYDYLGPEFCERWGGNQRQVNCEACGDCCIYIKRRPG